MGKKAELFLDKRLYNHKHTNDTFLKAVKENIRFHQLHNKCYADILSKQNFSLQQIRTVNDLYKIPVLPTLYFKSHKIFSMPLKRIVLKSTSSGTSGKKSQIGYDLRGLELGANMIFRMMQYHKLCSHSFTNYIIFGYQPNKSNQTVISKTAFASTLFAPARKRVYALKSVNGHYQLNFQAVKESLIKYNRQSNPVRLIGFPAFLYFFLQRCKEEGLRFKLPKGSMVFLGGGWKQFYTDKVEKEELFQLIENVLGIKQENCREFYGAVEHPMVYCSCKNHHFHVPTYSRVIVRDVDTLLPVADGEIGLMNFITPLLNAVPTVSVMTDDLGILHKGCECGCGIETPYFEIIGRVGLRDIKTCAALANDFLKGGNL